MDGVKMLAEARAAGLEVRAEGDRLVIRGPRKAEALAKRLLDNKAELLALLQNPQEPQPTVAAPPPGYLTGQAATAEGKRQLERRGWLPIWAEALGEPIILVLNEAAAKKAPKVYLVYTVEEMHALAGLSPDERRLIHESKKLFGGRFKEEKGDGQRGAHVGSVLERGDKRAGGLHRPAPVGCPEGAAGAGDHNGSVRDPEAGPGDLRGEDLIEAGSPSVGDPGLKMR